MIKILTGIGCIVVVLILMIPPFMFGYAICELDDDLIKFIAPLCSIEFVALIIAFIYCINGAI